MLSSVLLLCVAQGAALTIPDAKATVRSALAANGGQSKAPQVVDAIEALAALNPTVAPAKAASLCGAWKQINSPEYPGMLGLDSEGRPRYTLGRLAFNLFEPIELVCSISDISNPLSPGAGSANMLEYAIEIPIAFDASDGTQNVQGKLINHAECEILSDNRVSVRFHGGELRPVVAEESDAPHEAWTDTFGDALQKAKKGVRARLTGWLMKRMMGLEPPTAMAAESGVMAYTMSRAPEGYLDILFLDDEWRITKGNRGSIVVAERV